MISTLQNDNLGKLVIRLSLGVLILFHGYAKLQHTEVITMIGNHLKADGLPAFIAYAVYIGELIAPLMVIAGVYCRYGAIMIVINMLFAFGLFHMPQFFSLGHSGGWQLELQGFYLFSAIAVMFLGSGRWAIRPD
jgi:putative oxidoreductase